MFSGIFAANAEKKNAFRLYKALVEQARTPAFYLEMGVEDSMEGRFDLILLHLYLVDAWLERGGNAYTRLRRHMQEAMVSDMDRSFRELGVGDMSVGKEMKKVGAAWLGRRSAYATAFKEEDKEACVEAVLLKNVYRSEGINKVKTLSKYCINATNMFSNSSLVSPKECELDFVDTLISDAISDASITDGTTNA
ncbi:MAG: ubiquinol-cytochrome C chaperone [Kordiimonadales bacterium]|nr:MAG: ubiquinol-cytochrome C chaperone [Kordiimonadales bacterium]